MHDNIKKYLFAGMVLAGMLGLTSGCISSQPGSTSTAHLVMDVGSLEEIHDELVQVFEDEQYDVESFSLDHIVFSRPATQRDVVMYGEFLSGEIIMSVDVNIEPYRADSHLVRADVTVLMNGSPDKKVGVIGSRPYQSLLKRVKSNLVKANRE